MLAIAAGTVLVAAVWIGVTAYRRAPLAAKPQAVSAEQYEFLKQALGESGGGNEPEKPELRAVFKYSVVPSGVYSAEELKRALLDPVVAAHYAKVDPARIHTEFLKTDHYAYVSYRKGDKIYWTKNKVLLRGGEAILTDGQTRIRSRCGNCISEQPLEPTAADEPDLVEFDRLVDSRSHTDVPQTARMPESSTPAALAGVKPAAAPVHVASGSNAATLNAPIPIAGGVGAFGPIGIGSEVPTMTAKRAGARQPDDDSSSPEPQGPGAGSGNPDIEIPPIADLPYNPGGNNPTALSELPPPGGSDGPSGPSGPDGPHGPNGTNGFTPTEVPPDPASANDLNPVPVPEPGTLMLVGGGVAALLRKRLARSR